MRSKSWLVVLGVALFLALGCSSAEEGEGIHGVSGMAAPTGGSSGAGGGMAPSGGAGAVTGGMGAAGMIASGGAGGAGGMGTGGTMVVPSGGVGGAGGGDMSDSAVIDPVDAGDDPGFPRLPKVTTTDGPGSFTEVTKEMSTPPGGWLIYPTKLGEGGMRHPIFLFGPGGGTTPMTYETSGMHWDRYASYGFVIYALAQSTGDGAAMKAGLDWVIGLNEDSSHPLYQKLDTTKVAAAGHSMGSVTTFDFMPDDRVTTTIHISGGSFDMMGPLNLSKDTMFMCAMGEVATPQCDSDFEVSMVPTFYTLVGGASHTTSARLGWPATIAWLLWHLAGHDEWRAEFLEPDGQFQTGIYTSKLKNW